MSDSSTNINQILSVYIDALEISNRGAIFLNEKGVVIGVNSTFANQIGYEKAACAEKMIFEINPHLSVMGWRKLWKQLSKEESVLLEAEHLTADDELFPVKIKWELVTLGNAHYACGVVEDLISSSRFEDLLNIASEITSVAAWEWDLVHKEFFFTPQFNKLFNLPEKFTLDVDTMQSFLGNILSTQSADQLLSNVKHAIKTGEFFKLELDLKQRDNHGLSSINVVAKPLFLEDRTVKIYGTIQDMSSMSGRTEEMYLAQFCMDYAPDPILWIDEKGSITYANQAAALTYDYYSIDEFKTVKVFNLIPSLNEDNYSAHWEELADRGMLEYESEHITKEGTQLPVWVSLNFIQYQGKAFNCLFIKDLTEQKAQEESWQLTQFANDNAIEMIFWVREDGSFEYVNNRALELLGYSRDEIYQIDPFAISGDFPKENWPEVWQRFKENKHLHVETNYYKKNGEALPVSISSNYIEYQGKALACSHVRDLSKKKVRDEKIKLSMSTIDRASDMIFWIDEDAKVFYANEEASKNLGYTQKELDGIKLFKISQSRTAEEWPTYWAKIKEKKHLVYEGLMRRKIGKVFPVELTINHIVHDGKEMLSAYAKDITERKGKALKLELAYEEIKQLKEETEVENTILKDEIKLEYNFDNIISTSESYKSVLKKVEQVADSEATVLILGETGTGKELLARAVHQLSERSDKSMIKVNCGALPANLIESELFGHEKGAFTGAYQAKKGRFELAHKGTIFLDEIGELPLDLQAKLLRVLQEGEFEKLGSEKTIHVDVRVIAATNRDLEQKVAEKVFREDLYYRLNVFPIINIPLRERKDDIPPLVRFFVDKYSKKMGKKIVEIPQKALKKLTAYDFPGNVRELENIIERSIILSTDKKLSFDTALFRNTKAESATFPSLEESQKNHIVEALRRTNGRISGSKGASTLLQINDKTLVSRMKKLGIKKADYE